MSIAELSGYKTSDGTTFDDKAEAERHERFIQANKTFDSAVQSLERALAEKQKTADGELFIFGGRWWWFYVNEDYYEPRVERVSFYPFTTHVEIKDWGTPAIAFHVRDTGEKSRRYELSHLYHSENKAKQRLLELKQERLRFMQEDVETLQGEIK